MPTDDQPKVSIAMPVYNGDRHICQAPNFLLPPLSLASLLFLCVLCALCGSFNLIHPSCKDCYILANIEQNYNLFSTHTLI
jgi:hypothetical protein